MKLTKRGVNPKDVLRFAVCDRCHSEYEFALSDTALTYHKPYSDMRDGDSSPGYYSFKCEVCETHISVRT